MRHQMMFHVAVIVPVLVSALAVLPAQAHSPCDPTDNDRAEANRVLAGLTREIDVMEASIVEALRLQTGQLSGYAAQSAKAVTGALDAQTRLQAQIAREAAETDAMRARRPSDSACASITGLTALRGHARRPKTPMPALRPPRTGASRATGPSSTAGARRRRCGEVRGR